ncbi:MAG: hypothetical protein IIC66_03140 [candidate division Zixibacteria bacterium]|nr:hypothetical protein [candidate division Zixibacteria bacterium]
MGLWPEFNFEPLHKKITVFIISHDRYFLDRIVTKVMEIDDRKIFIYKGNYTEYVEQKSERTLTENNAIRKARAFLKKEKE